MEEGKQRRLLDKGTTRMKTSFSPGDEESAGKVRSSEEEIDFWQVRTRARTTYIVACALVADARWCARRTSSHKLVNVLRFSELLVKKLTTYGTALSLLAVTFSLPLAIPSSFSCSRALLTKSCWYLSA